MAKGFFPVDNQGGYDWIAKSTRYHVKSNHSTKLAIGDVVVITGEANSDGIAEVDAGATGGAATGVIVSIAPNFNNLYVNHLPASTAGYVYVNTDLNTLYKAEIATQALTAANVGSNVDIVATEAATSGGLTSSQMTLKGDTATTSAAKFRIEELIPAEDGTLGAIGGTAVVRLNESTQRQEAGA
jgi:hypothetical protein